MLKTGGTYSDHWALEG